MDSFIKVTTLKPRACDDKAIEDFIALVRAGGEVKSAGLGRRVRAAASLVFLEICCCVRGIAALKRPEQDYRKRVSLNSGIVLPEAKYPFEFGWVFVMPSARGRGLSLDLTQAALSVAGTAGVFATSHTGNAPMHKALEKCGFARLGRPYPSDRGQHKIQLFLRPGSENPAEKAPATD